MEQIPRHDKYDKVIERMNVIWLAAALTVVMLIGGICFFYSKKSVGALSYEPAGSLLSPAERSFYTVVSAAVGQTAWVLCKVRLVNVIKPKSGLSDARWRALFTPVAQNHLDFVLVDADSMMPLCVMEFDDSTPLNIERQKRNQFIQSVCDSADIPRVVIDARNGFAIQDIRVQLAFLWADGDSILPSASSLPEGTSLVGSPIKEVAGDTAHVSPPAPREHTEQASHQGAQSIDDRSSQSMESQPSHEPAASASQSSSTHVNRTSHKPNTREDVAAPGTLSANQDSIEQKPLQETHRESPGTGNSPTVDVQEMDPLDRKAGDVVVRPPDCPKCGSALTRRQPKTGKLAGQFIWVCSTFPTCRYMALLKAHKMMKRNEETIA